MSEERERDLQMILHTLTNVVLDTTPHKKKCRVTHHGFLEPVIEGDMNAIFQDLYDQGFSVDHVQVFFNPDNGTYTSFVSYTEY